MNKQTTMKMPQAVASIKAYVRATNYLTVTQIYLQNNFLLDHSLEPADIKPRLLGHWGTCPGINFVYAQLNYLILKHNLNMMFILGPGHGFPALQANLFLEKTLQHYYPQASHSPDGIGYLAKNFSWPYGFPSHTNPGTPGAILEGGELGYSLATAYGAVLDNPNLIATCLVGDGEAETGPIATAWHLNKLIDPSVNGAVLPILHLNEYKISGPTLLGRMSNEDLIALFEGYGYVPYIVEGENIYENMIVTLERCYQTIKRIQQAARNKKRAAHWQRFPMIILKTPKGWTGIKTLHGKKIEGNHYSHQVVAKNAKIDEEELQALAAWLHSYHFEELFDAKKGFSPVITQIIPPKTLRMGENKHTFGQKNVYKPLRLPNVEIFAEAIQTPGTVGSSSMRRAGLYLAEVFRLNQKNFRLFSPDETYSNKLDEVFAREARAFMLPIKKHDQDLSPTGRIMEMLSEHSLQGMLQGYIQTGRHAVFASYEAFIQIVASMVDQYIKFIKIARDISWRGEFASLNYILTSSGWRQEHNGFSHQNPSFIDSVLQKQDANVRVYFPADGNSTLVCLQDCLASTKGVNVIIAGKTCEPRWLTVEQARIALEKGLMIWGFASDPQPDIVLAAIGDYMTKEVLAAIQLLKQEHAKIRIRFINIVTLSAVGIGNPNRPLSKADFYDYFTHDKPVIINFHGHPQTLKQLLFDYHVDSSRFTIQGYVENGSTTTPFDMQVRNGTSRYQIVIKALLALAKNQRFVGIGHDNLVKKYQQKLQDHHEYIIKNAVDQDEIENWQWQK